MKLSISNIAWPNDNNGKVLEYLTSTMVSAIEIAPSRIWPDFRMVGAKERNHYFQSIRKHGLSICSMHSLYYNQANICIFGNGNEVEHFEEYTRNLIDLANDLEVPRMILGSPTVRDRGNLSIDEAIEYAAHVLFPLAEYAYSRGTKILIEALSLEDTNFINDHGEALSLIKTVNSRGFGLHLDAKAISSEPSDYDVIFNDCRGKIEHFHINEKKLGGFDEPAFKHEKMAEILDKCGYEGFVSIEMRQLPDYMGAIKTAVEYAEDVYINHRK